MSTLEIIGSGAVGAAVARLATRAGYDVVLSNSRGPGTLGDLVAELGPRAAAASGAEAAQRGDLVVIAVPVSAFPDLPATGLEGKVVIDATNYGAERDGPIAELDSGQLTSSVLLARHLPGAQVVKALNTISFRHLQALARPAGTAERSALPIASDSPTASAAAGAFISALGFDIVDAGSLADSWRQETGTPVWGTPYGPASSPNGRPADIATVRAALAAATR